MFFVAAALATGSAPAQASNMSIGFSTGLSSLSVKAGSTFSADGGSGYELRPQANFEFRSISASIDVFYQGRLGSNFGAFPLSRVGAGVYYYPNGFALQTLVADNGVIVRQNHFAYFFLANLDFATVAVSQDASQVSNPISFNGLAIGYQAGVGGEIPIGQTTSLQLTLIDDGTVSGGTSGASTTGSSGTASNVSLSYSSISFLLGVVFHI